MPNLILNIGDLVKYTLNDDALNRLGFVLGSIYKVDGDHRGLWVNTDVGMIALSVKGNLTDKTENFSKHQCPVILPVGRKAI